MKRIDSVIKISLGLILIFIGLYIIYPHVVFSAAIAFFTFILGVS